MGLKDNGTVGLRFGTDISFYHHTSRTDSESKAFTDFGPLVSWIKQLWNKPPEPKQETEGGAGGPGQ